MRGKQTYLWIFLLLGGCATKPSAPLAKKSYDFSKIRRITVMPFDGAGGPAATDELIRTLVGTGIEVTDVHHVGDVILKGTVTEYKPNNQLTIFLGNTTLMAPAGQTVSVDNPAVTLGGSQVAPETATLAAHNAQVVSIVASVAINAQVLDAATKAVLWTGTDSYESLDLPTALHDVAASMTQSLGYVIPLIPRPAA